MTAAEFLLRAVTLIEQAGLRYMVAGSFASSYYGESRTTRDLDLVVELTEMGIEQLVALADHREWYVSRAELLDALAEQRMANLIDLQSGWKLDVVVLKSRPFSQAEFDRRQRVELLGRDVFIASAEDTILAKLECSARSGSERQIADARAIARVQAERLDIDHLRFWAPHLGVADLLAEVLNDRPAG